MMNRAIYGRYGHHVIAEYAAPFAEGLVGGNQ